MPAKVPTEGGAVDLDKLIPEEHRAFVNRTLDELGVPPLSDDVEHATGVLDGFTRWRGHTSMLLWGHRIALIANALGSPPKDVIDQAHEKGVPVAALAGAVEHARRHVENGVDIVIAQGYEAGGHTGEIASMVLVRKSLMHWVIQLAVLAARRYRQRPSGGCRTCTRCVRSVDGLVLAHHVRIQTRQCIGRGPVRYSACTVGRDVGRHRSFAHLLG